jgi:rare lipoprotein A
MARELTWLNEPIHVAASGSLHRVRLGPYRNREEAQAIAEKVRQTLEIAPLITPATR